MALISHNHSFLSDSALYGSKQNLMMNKLPQSLHISARGEADAHISCQDRHVEDCTDFSGEKPSGPHTWENGRKVYAQVIQKEAFKHVHIRSVTGMHTPVK